MTVGGMYEYRSTGLNQDSERGLVGFHPLVGPLNISRCEIDGGDINPLYRCEPSHSMRT